MFLLTIVLYYNSSVKQREDNMRTIFIHLSDIHLRSNDKNIINVDSMFGNLKNKISKSEVVFLLFTGDFSNNAEINQFDSFKFLFEDIINYLRSANDNIKIIPLLVPGNHDINLSSEKKKGYIFIKIKNSRKRSWMLYQTKIY